MQVEPWRKENRARAFYFQGAMLLFLKKNYRTNYCYQKIMHSLNREKKLTPQKTAQPLPPPQKIIVSLFAAPPTRSRPCLESSRNVIWGLQEKCHNNTCIKGCVTHRINPSQISLVHSLLAFAFEADVIEVHLIRANQIPGRDLIVVTDMKIHLLIVYFFF